MVERLSAFGCDPVLHISFLPASLLACPPPLSPPLSGPQATDVVRYSKTHARTHIHTHTNQSDEAEETFEKVKGKRAPLEL